MVVLAAIIGDHHSRLQKMGLAEKVDDDERGRSLLDPVGSALGELGRADKPFKLIASLLDVIGKFGEFLYAPIGTAPSAIGKAFQLVFKPIGAALGAITGFGLNH